MGDDGRSLWRLLHAYEFPIVWYRASHPASSLRLHGPGCLCATYFRPHHPAGVVSDCRSHVAVQSKHEFGGSATLEFQRRRMNTSSPLSLSHIDHFDIMRTLFGENIHSPPAHGRAPPRLPITSSFHDAHPSESLSLTFHRASVASSATGSLVGSPSQNDWLTQQLQHFKSNDGETTYSHGQETPAIRRRGGPSIAFMGARRCGKSSIRNVVYEKLSPADTLYLEPTTKIEGTQMPGFVHIHGYEIPNNTAMLSNSSEHAAVFNAVGAVVWVIDCQDEYFSSIQQLLELAVFLAVNYPRLNLAVFVHKTDGLTDEYKYEAFREIRQRVQDELSDSGFGDRGVSYYQTSIFDHSIFEAMSKVVQKLLPQVPALESLLNRLCSACRVQKAYLFDTVSKIYIATDASPTFLRDYEVCSEYVDMVVDIKQLYGWHARGPDDLPGSITKIDLGENIAESVISYDKTGDTYMYAREVNDFLSIVCILGRGSSADKKMLIDYNTSIMHDALVKIFDL